MHFPLQKQKLTFFIDDRMCGVINWVSHLGRTLSFGHRLAILSNGRSGWLDDQIANYSCAMISDAFPHVFGFRPTTLFACSAKNIQREVPALRQRMLDPENSFEAPRQVQAVYINGNHWILASNLHDGPENHVLLYDSLSLTPDAAVRHQIAAVFRFSTESFVMEWPKVVPQDDGSKCGVYIIAYALALCQNRQIGQIILDHHVSEGF